VFEQQSREIRGIGPRVAFARKQACGLPRQIAVAVVR
jgi:hypothetical protein